MSRDLLVDESSSADAVDAEHQVQIGLVRALCDAIRSGAGIEQTRRIFEQLLEYSDVHFMSEQLLMRLASFSDYDDHLADHDHMIGLLHAIGARIGEGGDGLTYEEAQDMLRFLSQHIATRDRRFTEHYADWRRRAADGATGAPPPVEI